MSEPSAATTPAERPKIRILPDRVVNQIAAGEVIERPAAVVKELLENALDARSDRIEIEFHHGGKSYIRVEDNGIGMSPDEALIALERHATSKLRAADDLARILSLGFRGEALPSIASVSRFTLKTRAEGWDEGSELFVNGGKLIHQRACGMARGARIEVAHLFNSVPARRKFLKTDNTEASHITHLVRLHAVARPGVAFTLIEQGRVLFTSPKCPAMRDRVAEIWGNQLAQDLVELEPVSGENGLRLHGLIGKPGTGRATRRELITLVNSRPVDSRTLNYALIEGYHSYIPKGRYPLAFLFLEIDPAAVDVNIHPAKRELKFRDEGRVRQFVLQAVLKQLQSLARQAPLPPPVSGTPSEPESSLPQPTIKPESFRPLTHPGPVSEAFKEHYLKSAPSAEQPAPIPQPPPASAKTAPPPPAEIATEAIPPAATTPFRFSWRALGLLRDGTVLFESVDGLVAMDRRAAHERVSFEHLQKRFAEHAVTSQQLLFPLNFELDPRAADALEQSLAVLQGHGFALELFGRNFYRLTAYPDWLPEPEVERFLRDIIERLSEGSLDLSRPELADEALARLAAIRALKPSDEVELHEMQELARALLQCQQPLNSPRGRPTYFELSQREIARRFGR
ncbi:MAG: DNA mismatch repair endonuclease MutL [Verrucomicrobiota bacterium]